MDYAEEIAGVLFVAIAMWIGLGRPGELGEAVVVGLLGMGIFVFGRIQRKGL